MTLRPDLGDLLPLLDTQPEAQLLLDGDGQVLRANSAAARLLGAAADTLAGQPLLALLVDAADPADTAERLVQLLHQGSRSAQPTPGRLRLRGPGGATLPCRCEIATLRARQSGADGAEAIPALLWLRLTPQGNGLSRFAELNRRIDDMAREVERRRAAETALQEQREWLSVVLRSIGDAVIATDTCTRIVFMNPVAEALTGWPEADALGRPLAEIFVLQNELSGETVTSPVDEALRLHRIVRLARDTLLRTRGGQMLPLDDAAAPIIDHHGQVQGAVLVFREISERLGAEKARRTLEAQLREAQRLESIGTMAGGIAHDFNNVLGSILANAGMVRAELPPEHPSQLGLQQITTAGNRARELVRQILAFSRRQSQQLRRQALQPLVIETMDLLRGTLPSVVQLGVDLPTEPVYALVDATQLQQVLLNLCTNAWHALRGSSGQIRVRLEQGHHDAVDDAVPGFGAWQPGAYAQLSVSDDGCGIDAATLQHIFEPFFTTKPRGEGTGLGLSVAHGIIAEHRGTLAVSSRPGAGSRFSVYLPLATAPDAAAQPQARAVSAPPLGQGQRVAYIDDDEVMRVTVESLLQRAGFSVRGYASGSAALQALALPDNECDIVVSDFNMPQLSGLDVAQALRQLRPALPVVISSGYISQDLRAGARRLGVAALLNKEDTYERIAGVVDAVLRGMPVSEPPVPLTGA